MVDSNLCIKSKNSHQIIIVAYVDDIIFGGKKDEMCKEFANWMQIEFDMLMIGEILCFLILQVNQLKNGNLFCKSSM